jgi:RNA polymerase-binding transcription factor DksA
LTSATVRLSSSFFNVVIIGIPSRTSVPTGELAVDGRNEQPASETMWNSARARFDSIGDTDVCPIRIEEQIMSTYYLAPRDDAPLASAAGLAILRDILERERALQEAAVSESEATVTELTGQGDVDSILERELAEASIARALEVIVDIDLALARIDEGTFGGVCESCGGEIAPERLEAIPQTRLCVRCAAASRPPQTRPRGAPIPAIG